MKKFLRNTLIPATILMAGFLSCSTKKTVDPMILPGIAFKTDAGYTHKDTTVPAGTTLLTGINATKTELNDVLKAFSITRSYDGGTASSVNQQALSAAQGDSFSYDYTITTRSTAGTEKYTYTISNRDGLVNSISLTVTTQ